MIRDSFSGKVLNLFSLCNNGKTNLNYLFLLIIFSKKSFKAIFAYISSRSTPRQSSSTVANESISISKTSCNCNEELLDKDGNVMSIFIIFKTYSIHL